MSVLLLVVVAVVAVAGVVLMKPLGAIRPLEFMALAGDTQQRNGQQEQGEMFHRGAS